MSVLALAKTEAYSYKFGLFSFFETASIQIALRFALSETMYTVYVLFSPSFRKIYIGYTSNLVERLKSHNHLGKKGYTIRFRPWIVAFIQLYNTKSEEIKREFFLKSGIGFIPRTDDHTFSPVPHELLLPWLEFY